MEAVLKIGLKIVVIVFAAIFSMLSCSGDSSEEVRGRKKLTVTLHDKGLGESGSSTGRSFSLFNQYAVIIVEYENIYSSARKSAVEKEEAPQFVATDRKRISMELLGTGPVLVRAFVFNPGEKNPVRWGNARATAEDENILIMMGKDESNLDLSPAVFPYIQDSTGILRSKMEDGTVSLLDTDASFSVTGERTVFYSYYCQESSPQNDSPQSSKQCDGYRIEGDGRNIIAEKYGDIRVGIRAKGEENGTVSRVVYQSFTITKDDGFDIDTTPDNEHDQDEMPDSGEDSIIEEDLRVPDGDESIPDEDRSPGTLNFSEDSFQFGKVFKGHIGELEVTLQKSGEADVIFEDAVFTGPFRFVNGVYPGGGNCGNVISSDCTVVLEFNPEEAGSISGTVKISYGDNGETLSDLHATGGDVLLTADMTSFPADTTFSLFTNIGNSLYFAAENSESGKELWVSDGTELGTKAVEAIPGYYSSYPEEIVSTNGYVFFSGYTITNEKALYRLDNLGNGNYSVDNLDLSSVISIRDLVNVSGEIVFNAQDRTDYSSHIYHLKNDVTGYAAVEIAGGPLTFSERVVIGDTMYFTSGNALYKLNFENGSPVVFHYDDPNIPSNIVQLTAAGSDVYFVSGNLLYKLEGTFASPYSGTEGAISNMTYFDMRLYFIAGTSIYYTEPSSPDNVVFAVESSSTAEKLFVAAGKLFFLSPEGLMWFDVANSETKLVSGAYSTVSSVVEAGSDLYFVDSDRNLFRLIQGGSQYSGEQIPDVNNAESLVNFQGELYFGAADISDQAGRELRRLVNGKSELVKDINPGSGDSDVNIQFESYGGKMFFKKRDNSLGFFYLEKKLSGEGFDVVKADDIPADASGLTRFKRVPVNDPEFIDTLYFIFEESIWRVVYEAGRYTALKVNDVPADIGVVRGITTLVGETGDIIYINSASSVWKYDGADYEMVVSGFNYLNNLFLDVDADVKYGIDTSRLRYFKDGDLSPAQVEGNYEMYDEGDGFESSIFYLLPSGTYVKARSTSLYSDMVYYLDKGSDPLVLEEVTGGYSTFFNGIVFKDSIYFTTKSADLPEAVENSALWKVAGGEKTAVIVDGPFADRSISHVTVFNDSLFYVAGEVGKSSELKIVLEDETVKTVAISPILNNFYSIAVFDGKLLLAADDGSLGVEYWLVDSIDLNSDPVEIEARLLRDINQDGSSFPYGAELINEKLFFKARENINGKELWYLTFE